MKRFVWILFLLLCYLFAFPARALDSARSGLLLWYHSVLPVLFPFMLLCGLLIRFNLLERALPYLSRPFRFLFGCSQYGAFAIVVGFLCGFPMGAKITHDLLEQGKIDRQEAYVLYGFVNNLSPSFLLSFLAADQMGLPAWGGLFLCNILGAALLYGLLSSGKLRRRDPVLIQPVTPRFPSAASCSPGPAASSGAALPSSGSPAVSAPSPDIQEIFRNIDDCIYDTIQNTVKLGAYIVMFSLLLGAFSLPVPADHPAALLFTSCIEVSSGIHQIASSSLPFFARYFLVCVLGAFGGLSALAQSASVAAMDRSLFLHYTKSRVIITLLSAILTLGSILLFRFRVL